MRTASSAVDALDTSLFQTILSQTSEEERRTLLALQRAVARRYGAYTYLEIGSYLGGSLQPHVADPRCQFIFSVDPRPDCPPDDRTPGQGVTYQGNSKQRMLDSLAAIDERGAAKIICLDSDAKHVPTSRIAPAPHILFIDGEHTHAAALSDFAFCEKVAREDAVIVFHDFGVIHEAVLRICQTLKRAGRAHLPLRLEGSLFAIFFDQALVESDPYLADLHRKYGHLWKRYILKNKLSHYVPDVVLRWLLRTKRAVTG